MAVIVYSRSAGTPIVIQYLLTLGLVQIVKTASKQARTSGVACDSDCRKMKLIEIARYASLLNRALRYRISVRRQGSRGKLHQEYDQPSCEPPQAG